MSKYSENYTNISVSNEIYEELGRRRTNPKESGIKSSECIRERKDLEEGIDDDNEENLEEVVSNDSDLLDEKLEPEE